MNRQQKAATGAAKIGRDTRDSKSQPQFSTPFVLWFTLWRFARGHLSHDEVIDTFVCHRRLWLEP
jgi:hypothetical protein